MQKSPKKNYRIEMQRILDTLERRGEKPRLLLHSCCAPCSSAVLEQLTKHFEITVFYYNPNISPKEEFEHRVEEQARLIRELPHENTIEFLSGEYDPEAFYAMAKGHESDPEGGERCTGCYRLRLEKTARVAAENGFDYFTTTLSISPLKDAERLNTIGAEMAQKYAVPYLFSDFKKQNGYKRSCELSAEYGLYRQDYCGCVYSKLERERIKEKQNGIRFYGEKESLRIAPLDASVGVGNPKELYDCLLKLWSAETCAPRLRDRWTPQRPTTGQCSVTAFLAQELFGGEVYGIDIGGGAVHCFNRVGEINFDLTNAQFEGHVKTLDYASAKRQTREEHFLKEEKRLRYEKLREGLRKRLSDDASTGNHI